MGSDFGFKRRQKFMTAEYFSAHQDRLVESIALWLVERPVGDSEKERTTSAARLVADDRFSLLVLRYTAGCSPVDLRSRDLPEVIDAYERYQRALGISSGVPPMAPLGFEDIDDYERALQLVSLCYLLHRRDLLPRLRAMLDPGYAGRDTIYEDLMAFDVEGRFDVDEWYHAEPYTRLVDAMYHDRPQADADLKDYCDHWYKAFEQAPWHDGHLRIEGTEGDYFGYWAFEAGAVALLYELDDSAITHMVYPKDLVAWARANARLSEEDAQGRVALRVAAGEACLRGGWWVTPARAGSRRRFAPGDVMPDLGGDYGATIWQWDDNQA